jgi:hypothetical protein
MEYMQSKSTTRFQQAKFGCLWLLENLTLGAEVGNLKVGGRAVEREKKERREFRQERGVGVHVAHILRNAT